MTRSTRSTAHITVEVEIVVRGTYTAEDPGRLYGPPEDCYPPEPAEFSMEKFHVMGRDGTELEVPDAVRDWLVSRVDVEEMLESARENAS